jgi:hypothetical protein
MAQREVTGVNQFLSSLIPPGLSSFDKNLTEVSLGKAELHLNVKQPLTPPKTDQGKKYKTSGGSNVHKLRTPHAAHSCQAQPGL